LLCSTRLRGKKSNQLLLNLSIGHMMTGACHFAGLWTIFPVGKFVFFGIAYASVSLIVLSIDRCFYIVLPLRYYLIHRCWHITFMLISPAFAMMVLLQYILSGFEEYVHESALANIPFIVVVFVMSGLLLVPNLVVFRIVRKQRVQIEVQCNIIKSNEENSNSNSPDIARVREVRSFYLCFGCVITFVLCWMPLLAFKTYEIRTGRRLDYKYNSRAAIIATINPFMDVLFSVWFNKELRGRLKDVFKS